MLIYIIMVPYVMGIWSTQPHYGYMYVSDLYMHICVKVNKDTAVLTMAMRFVRTGGPGKYKCT